MTVKYSLTKAESAVGMAIVVSDFLFLTGHSVASAIGYGVIAGIGGYFGKHFITNSIAQETATASEVAKA
jgi:hypothetical protein